MNLLAITTFWILVGLVISQGVLVVGFVIALRRFQRPLLPDDACPRATVVLCLRGTDPFLPRCVEAILSQDYPDYEVRVIVDSKADPAWEVVERVVAQRGESRVRMEVLTAVLPTCSLKCSSLVQVVSSLDDSVEIIAQLDADTIPHPTWLRELAGGLAGDDIAAATGNRWYMPDDHATGSLIRYLWNAAAVVQMYWYSIAWGGTLAVKVKAVRQAGLLERWSNAFCEDTMLFAQLRKHGLRVRFVPSLMMVNRESCDVDAFFHWVRRQLLTARLYHPGWSLVVLHGINTTVFPVFALLVGIASLVVGNWPAATWSLGGLGLYQAAMIPLLGSMELAMRGIVQSRGESCGWLSWGKFFRLLASLPITQGVYARALLSALVTRQVDWRGVTYRVGGPWEIRLEEYRPYAPPGNQGPSRQSL